MARKARKSPEASTSSSTGATGKAIKPGVHNDVAPERARLVEAYAAALSAYRVVERAHSPEALQELEDRQNDVHTFIQTLREPMQREILQAIERTEDHRKAGELASHFNYLMSVVTALQDPAIWKMQK